MLTTDYVGLAVPDADRVVSRDVSWSFNFDLVNCVSPRYDHIQLTGL